MTYTVALLEISAAAYDEIKAKFAAIDDGYELSRRALFYDGKADAGLDMSGLAIVRAPEPARPVMLNVTVNGRQLATAAGKINYARIVALAGLPPRQDYMVTFKFPNNHGGGFIVPGFLGMELEEGMIFNCVRAGAA